MKKKNFYFSMLLFAVLAFTSCERETTYTFKFNADLSGIPMTAIVYEYDGDSKVVGQKSFDCFKGLTRVETVDSKAKKVKIKTVWGSGSSSLVYWVIKVYYLEPGNNINIEINEDTRFIPYEPLF